MYVCFKGLRQHFKKSNLNPLHHMYDYHICKCSCSTNSLIYLARLVNSCLKTNMNLYCIWASLLTCFLWLSSKRVFCWVDSALYRVYSDTM